MNIPKAQSALTPKSDLPWSSKDAIVRLIIYYGLIMVFMMTLQLGFVNLVNLFNKNINIVVEAAVIGIVGLILTYIFLSIDGKKFKSIGLFLPKNLFLYIIIGLIVTAISLSIAYVIEISGGVVNFQQIMDSRYQIENFGKIRELIDYLIMVFITFVGIAIGEEIIFRGYIQNLAESQTSFLKATFVSAVLFGFLHSFLNLTHGTDVIQWMVAVGVSAVIFGFVFSYAYEISGRNLFLPIIIHGTWDSIIYFFKTDYNYHNVLNVVAEISSQIIAAIVLIGLLYTINKYMISLGSEKT